MQAIVRIIGRDCTKPHVWEGGLPGPLLFHHSFVFCSRGFMYIKHFWFSLCARYVFLARSCPPAAAQVPAPATQWPRRSKLEMRNEEPDPFLPKSCHFLAASLLSAPGTVKHSLGGLALSGSPGPFFTWFPAFLLPADRASQDVLIFKPVKVTTEMDLSGL